MITMNAVANKAFTWSVPANGNVHDEMIKLEKYLKKMAAAIAVGDTVMNVKAAIVSVDLVMNDKIEVTLSVIDGLENVYMLSFTKDEWKQAIHAAMSV